jgi:hypothetical protein
MCPEERIRTRSGWPVRKPNSKVQTILDGLYRRAAEGRAIRFDK